MPPKHVGEELRDLVKNIRDGTFEYKNRDKSDINWAKYDYAQIKEMADYLNNIRDIHRCSVKGIIVNIQEYSFVIG